MNASIESSQKYSIQWAAVFAYAAILGVGLTGWIGVFHLASMLFK